MWQQPKLLEIKKQGEQIEVVNVNTAQSRSNRSLESTDGPISSQFRKSQICFNFQLEVITQRYIRKTIFWHKLDPFFSVILYPSSFVLISFFFSQNISGISSKSFRLLKENQISLVLLFIEKKAFLAVIKCCMFKILHNLSKRVQWKILWVGLKKEETKKYQSQCYWIIYHFKSK